MSMKLSSSLFTLSVLAISLGCTNPGSGSGTAGTPSPDGGTPVTTESLAENSVTSVVLTYQSPSIRDSMDIKLTWLPSDASEVSGIFSIKYSKGACPEKSVTLRNLEDEELDASFRDVISRSVISHYPTQVDSNGTPTLRQRPIGGGQIFLSVTSDDDRSVTLALNDVRKWEPGVEQTLNTANEFSDLYKKAIAALGRRSSVEKLQNMRCNSRGEDDRGRSDRDSRGSRDSRD